ILHVLLCFVVELSPDYQAADAGQVILLVLAQNRQHLLASRVHATGRLELLEGELFLRSRLAHGDHPTMSRAAWPAGIIGYVFSSRVTRTSTRTGPGVAIASFMPSTRVFLSSSRRPV